MAGQPRAWSQFGLLVVAFVLAVLLSRWLKPRLTTLLTPEAGSDTAIAKARRFVLIFLPLLTPLLAFALTSLGEQVTRSLFGSGAVIAFGKRVFLFLAVRAFVRDMVTDGFLKLIGRFVLMPVAALYALGLLEPVAAWLEATKVPLGNLSFDLLWAIRFLVVGGVIFWLGRWSNEQSSQIIEAQDDLRPATRQLGIEGRRDRHFWCGFSDTYEHHGRAADLAGGAVWCDWCGAWVWASEDCF